MHKRALRLLVVEDEPEILNIYREQLGDESLYEADFSSHPETALDNLRSDRDRYDLLIVDLTMPRKSGEGLIFDAKLINPDLKVIVVSAYPDLLNVPKDFGVRVFSKPQDLSVLLKNLAM